MTYDFLKGEFNMCTGLSLVSKDNNHFFGRNMDLEYNFGQHVTVVPRNYPWTNVITNSNEKTKYAIIGMCTMKIGRASCRERVYVLV